MTNEKSVLGCITRQENESFPGEFLIPQIGFLIPQIGINDLSSCYHYVSFCLVVIMVAFAFTFAFAFALSFCQSHALLKHLCPFVIIKGV